MKIRLIEPKPPGHHIFSMAKLPRLGLPLIGTRLAQHGHDVKIYVEDLAPINEDDLFDADLIGISATTSTATRAYYWADRARRKEIPVIMGGAHVSFLVDEALEHADFVARGESGVEIMEDLIEGLQWKNLIGIEGLSYRVSDRVRHNEDRCRATVLDELPFPDLTLIHGYGNMTTTPIMTSWGCPFDCNFCSVTAMFGKKYRFRSPENVIAELKEKNPEDVFFYDDNLAANKKRLKILLQMIIDSGLKFKWTAQVRTDVTRDPELLRLMKESGCWTVYIGFESVNQATLDGYHKSQNVQDIIDAVEKLHQYDIRVHGMFVLGADSDPFTVVKDTVDFAITYGIDTIMLNSLTPLPGTALYDEMESAGRIFDHRWEYYDALHIVFVPKSGTPYDFQMEGIKGYKRFYPLRKAIKQFLSGDRVAAKYSFGAWWIVQQWLHAPRNKEYLEWLKSIKPVP
jgi:radical SAM superfamily enzyme YgiQ (UPF0313 family)